MPNLSRLSQVWNKMPNAKSQPVAPQPPTKAAAGLKSMTGYAQAQIAADGVGLRVSIRAVNHRFLDLHLRVPEGFEPLEPRIRQIVRERVRRGHLDVTLRYELAGPAAVAVNQEIAAAYLRAAEELRRQYGLKTDTDIASILRLPGVIGSAAVSSDDEIARLDPPLAACLHEALDKLDQMRALEAVALRDDMSARLVTIARSAARVSVLAEQARPAFARRLEARLKELLGEMQIDPARLAQEAAMAAERSDVSEELARLSSHVRQFEDLLSAASDVGKKLDFLLQEMQREANTLLSKTPGNESESLEITELALGIKAEIEKIREQVQNIE
jgi:uncharacterized protein (TIGR00255 family)